MSLGVYLHLPFCRSRCRYCAFYSGEPLSRCAELVKHLGTEMSLRAGDARGPVRSVYFGGGTPSLMAPEQIWRLLRGVRQTWGLDRFAEVTLEVNPADRLPLKAFRAAGITRLSVGVQSLDDRVLGELARRHTADQARDTLAAATAAGFTRISADLLMGLPGTSPDELGAWVVQLTQLGAGHLSLYSLELHSGTELSTAAAEGRFRLASEAMEEAQFLGAVQAMASRGLQPYEVSNFALPRHRSRHNLAYWRGAAYIGLGPGAHSFLPGAGPWGTRRWNGPDLGTYLDALDREQLPPGGGEELTREQALLERLFLAFRCNNSVVPGGLADTFGLDPNDTRSAFQALAEQGMFEVLPGERMRPAWETMRRADGLASRLHGRLLAGLGAA